MASNTALLDDQSDFIQAEQPGRWQFPSKLLPKISLPRLIWPNTSAEKKKLRKTPELKAMDQRFLMSGASFGLAASGMLLSAPAMTLASIPFTLYVFVPAFKRAGQALTKDKKINDQVLIATRVTVCLGVGFTFIASLDALLQAFSQRTFAYNKENYQQTLPVLANNATQEIPADIKALLAQHSPDQIQQLGERDGEKIAPWMLATFAVATPLIGVAHGAAFLTTTFGAHFRYLGPFTSQRFVLQALRENIVILQPDALNRLTQINTLVVDANILNTKRWQLQADAFAQIFDQRQIRVISSDAISEPLEAETTAYIGEQPHPLDLQHQPAVTIQCCDASGIKPPIHHDIILLGDELLPLFSLFKLADAYAKSQKFNQKAPNRFDAVDIGTTLLLGFGLIYSVGFTYSGLLTSAAHADHSLDEYRQSHSERKDLIVA